MARAISMRNTIVPPGDRDEFREKAVRAKAHYAGEGCQYWLFEEASLPGAFVEFFEAGDPDTLQRAHRGAPDPIVESARMYVEVNLG
jgi:hypothetical protein